MRRVVARSVLAVLVFLLLPTGLLAQEEAWVPPKGELFWSIRYQWYKADEHLLSSAVLTELTPLEELQGVDFDSAALDLGKMESQVVVMDADIGITDRLALSGGLAFVQENIRRAETVDQRGRRTTAAFTGIFKMPGSACATWR